MTALSDIIDHTLRRYRLARVRAPSTTRLRRPTGIPVRLLAGVFAVFCAACDRSKVAPGNDTASPVPPPPPGTIAAPAASSGWNQTDGPVMLVGGSAPREATVVFPMLTDLSFNDSVKFEVQPLRGSMFDLFRRSGGVGDAKAASLVAPDSGDGCLAWPTADMGGKPGVSLPMWTVGFASGHARAIPLDSTESLSRADSTQLAADLARTSSALPDDTVAAFRGIPFVVRGVYRFFLPPATGSARKREVIIADVNRRLATEANPREERLLLIAERDSGATDGLTAGYTLRNSGAEDAVEATEVLAAVDLGTPTARRPAVVLNREIGNTTGYAMVERVSAGKWRMTWKSAWTGC